MAWQPDYCALADLRPYVGITDPANTQDDARLSLAITAASRSIDRAANRQFGLVAAPELRTYTARWDTRRQRWVIDVDDLMTATGLTVTTVNGTVDVFAKQPANAPQTGQPWTRLVVQPESAVKPVGKEDEVSVTAKWGWTTVPDTIKTATLLQAARLFKRKDAPFGISGSPEMQGELRLLAQVDPDVSVMVGPYRRWWGAA